MFLESVLLAYVTLDYSGIKTGYRLAGPAAYLATPLGFDVGIWENVERRSFGVGSGQKVKLLS